MVNFFKRFRWLCVGVFLSAPLYAADLPVYKIGDKAQEDIKATVPFDVVDAQATAALKASKAQSIAAIYRFWTGSTNVVAEQFLKAFAQAHTSFSNYLVAAYHKPTIDDETIEASDFGYLLTAFNVQNKKFPVTTELAVTWAHGDSGVEFRDKWLALLLKLMSSPVQPDRLPAHFSIYGRKIRIMPVANLNEKFTFDAAWRRGYVVHTSVPTVFSTREKFRQEFSENEQPLAGVLAQFIQPNCFPDADMTLEARDFSVRQLVVSDHFTVGQVIVERGATIDANAMAALNAMNKELMPGALSQQVAAEQQRAQQEQARAEQEKARAEQEQQQAQSEHVAAQVAQQQQQQEQLARKQAESRAQKESENAAAMREQVLNAQKEALDAQNLAQRIHESNEWLLVMLGALGMVSILALVFLWRLARQRTAPIPTPAKLQRIEKQGTQVSTELAPFLAQTLKDAVVQGLAAQRAELLEAQRMAAVEIAELVHRLDQLQVPMQERLRAYQDRIQELQKELAERTEENRELLKLKIDMMREQLETERGRRVLN